MMEQLLQTVFPTLWEKLGNGLFKKAEELAGFKSKLDCLEGSSTRLSAIASDVETKIRNEEVSGKKRRKREVEVWLVEVQKIMSTLQRLQTELQQEGFVRQFFRGNQIGRLNSMVDELIQQHRDFGDNLLHMAETRGDSFFTSKLIGEAFEVNLRRILELLANGDTRTIGIYGMGGAGKTTSPVHNEILEKTQLHVYWITVSQEYSLSNLQQKIAEVVGINLSGETDENRRSSILKKVLSQKKDFVLILDDVWDSIRLESLGDPVDTNKGKVIITTRSLEVCRRIGCQEKIEVGSLKEHEAWNLFRETLGHETILTPRVEETAKAIAKECDGLPLGIITVAGSMKGVTSIHVWRDALTQMNSTLDGCDDWEEKVFRVLKYSFDRLDPKYIVRGERKRYTKFQCCFLYCSLYPEDHKITRVHLIRKFISEKLMDKRERRKEEFDQGHAILDKLVNVSLLESVDGGNGVKMHDLIRDMALKIASKYLKFKVLAGFSLKDAPIGEEEWSNDVEKMSLMRSCINKFPERTSPNCPNLSTLLLNNNSIESLPDSFFSRMCGLQVLDLSRNPIKKLPDALSELETLHSLILSKCWNLVCVPNLGKLKALTELDLSRTGIDQVPKGMENLVKLKYLSLVCTRLNFFPTGLLPKLSHLQSLLLPHRAKVLVEEIKMLKQLEEFRGRLDLRGFNGSQLNQTSISFYNILAAPENDHVDFYGNFGDLLDGRKVTLHTCNVSYVSTITLDVKQLHLYKCYGLSNRFMDDLARLDNPRSLRSLEITSCSAIECILRLSRSDIIEDQLVIDKGEWNISSLFALEEIGLYELEDFNGLIEWEIEGGIQGGSDAPPPPPSLLSRPIFSSIRELTISGCHKIKKLGLPLLCLQNIEILDISNCAEIEEIIEVANVRRCVDTVSMPKLVELDLKDLPKLGSICEATMICHSIRSISLLGCTRLKKLQLFLPINSSVDGQPMPFTPPPPPALKFIFIYDTDKEWWEALEWEHPSYKDVLQPLLRHF